ncbi:MAG TPA: RNA polymerase factor sigma-32 [Polyangiales bacterium]|nr:RNA polymerase factor sigma-32 [Polyangiales bacterium]
MDTGGATRTRATDSSTPARRDTARQVSRENADIAELDQDQDHDQDQDDALAAEVVIDTDADSGDQHPPALGDEDELDFDAVQAEVVDVDVNSERGAGQALRVQRSAPLARYDPLQAYMRDVQRYKLLTPQEEHETAVRYFDSGDVDAAARLVTANLRLVVKIAYDYRRAHKNINDLIQEGSIGLMQAVKKYDPYKGVKLSTYAAWWIRAYILRFILNNARLVKVGTTQAQRKLFFNLRKEKARLSAMGIEATPETIAKRLDVPTEDVVQMDRRLAAGDMSLDAPVNAAEGSTQARVDFLPARIEAVDSALADAELGAMLREQLVAFGETLKGKEAQIFHQRMLTEEPRTLQELGDEFGVSRERVRQLEKRLQLKLKQYLSDKLGTGLFEP